MTEKEFLKNFKKHLKFFLGKIPMGVIHRNIKLDFCPFDCLLCDNYGIKTFSCKTARCPKRDKSTWAASSSFYCKTLSPKIFNDMIKEVKKYD